MDWLGISTEGKAQTNPKLFEIAKVIQKTFCCREVTPENNNMENITMWAEKNHSPYGTTDARNNRRPPTRLNPSQPNLTETVTETISQNDAAKIRQLKTQEI